MEERYLSTREFARILGEYLSTNGSPVVLGLTSTHEVWVKLANSHRGTTPLTEFQVFADTIKCR